MASSVGPAHGALGRRAAFGGRVAALGAATFVFGAVVTAGALRFDDAAPWLLLALSVAPLLGLVALAAPLVGVAAAFATFPVGSVAVPTGVISLQSVEAAVLLVAVLVILRRLGTGRTPLPWSPPLWWALALIAWALAGLPSAVDKTLALKQLASLGGGLVFACVVLATCRDMTDLRRLLGMFTAIAGAIAGTAVSAGTQFQSTFEGGTVSGRLEGAFNHPNQLGAFCALAAPVATGLLLGARTRLARAAAAVVLALVVAALMLSLSRGAWIGTALAFLFVIVTLPEARRLVVLVGVPLLTIAALIGSFAPTSSELHVVGERAHALTTLSPYDERPSIYREAVREIRADPWTGQGAGSFPVASGRAGSEASTVSAEHAHNLLLTWAAEAGLPAALMIVGLAVALALAARAAARAALVRGDVRDRALVAGLTGALLSVVGQGFFDYVLRNAVIFVAVWGLIGALLVCRREAARYGNVRASELLQQQNADVRGRVSEPLSAADGSPDAPTPHGLGRPLRGRRHDQRDQKEHT
jgi:putative inorganic carbon (HCO3(-)) transporter